MSKKVGENGIKLIQSFESCRLVAYHNPGEAYYTIGWGHYGPDVRKGQSITQSEADKLFKEDLQKYEKYVNNVDYVTITNKLTQNQFDALVSFCYNCGQANLKSLCKGKSASQISEGFSQYVRSKGKVLSGLVRRREAERELFNSSASNSTSSASLATTFSTFIAEAEKHVGENADWTWKTYGQSGIEWCAAFVCAVAKTVGHMIDVVIVNTAWAQGIARESVKREYGKFYKGPNQRGKTTPQKGDLIFFRWSNKQRSDKFDCDHVGIVVSVSSDTIVTIEGNSGTNNKNTSRVTKNHYSPTYNCISGYYRPNWDLVGGTSTSIPGSNLYDHQNTREDMTLREVGYVSSKYEPSIKKSDIRLSIINYTTMLSSLYELVNLSDCKVTYHTSKLKKKSKIVIDFLLEKGLSGGASCGIAANLYVDSKFDTAYHKGLGYGICNWTGQDAVRMKKHAGKTWSTSLTHQLEFLWSDMTANYSLLMSRLILRTNTEDSSARSAEDFGSIYSKKLDLISEQQAARKYFDQLTVVEPRNNASSSSNLDSLSSKKVVDIPASVKQNGLTANFTCYTDFFSRWCYTARTVADVWDDLGRQSSKGIATIDGCYLVAVTPTFGVIGDAITVYLADGQDFDAIVADAKNMSDSNCNKWGHILGTSGVDIIEWESISRSQQSIKLGTWRGQKVTKIVNKGTHPKIEKGK